MIAQFMKRPEEFHLSARVFREIAEALGAELWMLFIPKFPFGAMGQGKPVKQITGEGYRLLKVFEGLPDDKRKAILDYTLFQIAETEPVQARQIREARAQYKAAPLPAGSPYPYKKCSEDFD
ncbi:MAG: hypothetical protein BWK73_04755 [Thiothrix lacustris]|uniref:Uncharacterized protein n=1 Tax=Thiothrix lacustris TaxID=525917 RepID=A0A1Y1QXP1_9GAMM|nr:MAG: hypothetical protein BWK73_04755 [Thiothrix lacustris]